MRQIGMACLPRSSSSSIWRMFLVTGVAGAVGGLLGLVKPERAPAAAWRAARPGSLDRA